MNIATAWDVGDEGIDGMGRGHFMGDLTDLLRFFNYPVDNGALVKVLNKRRYGIN